MLARSFNTDTRTSLNREIDLSTSGQKQSIFQPQDRRNNSFNRRTKADNANVLMLARSFNTDTRASLNRLVNLSTTGQKHLFFDFFQPQNKTNQSTTERCNLSLKQRTKAISLSTTGQKQSFFQPQITSNQSFNQERCNLSFNHR
jgi:hypothetical protein